MQVTVFTTPSCVQCRQTKKVLDRYEIAYDAIDLTQHPEQAEIFKKSGYASAPIVVAGESTWSGFRLDRLDQLRRRIFSEQSHDTKK